MAREGGVAEGRLAGRIDMLGAILVGGESRRMGFPKQMIPWNGEPLAWVLAGRLREVTGRWPVLLGPAVEHEKLRSLRNLPDAVAGIGPLGGLLSMMSVAADAYLVLATDLPLMSQEALAWIGGQALKTEKAAVWPRLPHERHGEPLAAVYRPLLASRLREAAECGQYAMWQAVPAECRAEPWVPEHLLSAFTNINAPEHLARLTVDG